MRILTGFRTFRLSGFIRLSFLIFLLNGYLCAPFFCCDCGRKLLPTWPKKFPNDRGAGRVSLKKVIKMPKVKTNSSAKKRFKVTGTGKITHQKSFKRHILTKKSKRRKRGLRVDGTVHKSNVDFVKRLLRLK
jgi:large subunit ribosomal protein L35